MLNANLQAASMIAIAIGLIINLSITVLFLNKISVVTHFGLHAPNNPASSYSNDHLSFDPLKAFIVSNTPCFCTFLADRTIGRAYATVSRLSVVRRPSSVRL